MNDYISGNNKKRFSILVSFYDKEKERSVVELYDSIECVVANAYVLINPIANLCERDSVSWHNLVLNFVLSYQVHHIEEIQT